MATIPSDDDADRGYESAADLAAKAVAATIQAHQAERERSPQLFDGRVHEMLRLIDSELTHGMPDHFSLLSMLTSLVSMQRAQATVDQASPTTSADKHVDRTILNLSNYIIASTARRHRGTVDSQPNNTEDQDMDPRITGIEKDLSTVKVDLAVVRSNYATKDLVQEVKHSVDQIKVNYATNDALQEVKQTVDQIKANYATKDALQEVKQSVDQIKANYATNEALQEVKQTVDQIKANYATKESVQEVKQSIDQIKANYATKESVQEVKQSIDQIKANYATKESVQQIQSTVDLMKATYSTKEDLHREINAQTWKMITVLAGLIAGLVAAVYFIVRPPQQTAAPTAPQRLEQPVQPPR